MIPGQMLPPMQMPPNGMPPGPPPMQPLQQLQLDGPPEEIEDEEDESLRIEREMKIQQTWLSRIKAEQQAHKDFRDRAKEVHKVYRPRVKPGGHHVIVPLYWEVVNVGHAGVYSSQPVPDCRPRNDERDPTYRQAADILERAISFYVDDQSFDDNVHRAIDDFLSVGLGVVRIKMEAVVNEGIIGNQSLKWDYVPWNRFGWEPCNNWRQCDWIYYRHPMTQKQIKARFGRNVKASSDTENSNREARADNKLTMTFDIYEVWDKKARKVIFLAKGEQTPLEINDDPLELEGFFPGPRPLMTNLNDEELIPKPDYDYIQAFDEEINRLQERRRGLLEAMKASGAYDSGLPELGDMLELEDGQYSPISQLSQRLSTVGGPDGIIYHLPLAEKMAAIQSITEQITLLRQQIDEILGISDITRGVTNAHETLGAQEIKGRWVGIRLTRKRDQVQYTTREMFRIMGQLLSTHYTPENLKRLTQIEATPQTVQLLQSDLMMDFAIDIEAESTVAKDEFRERETRQEMMAALGAYAQAVMPMVQQGALPADVSSSVLMAALQPYTKYSRGLDEALGSLTTNQQQLQQMQQQISQLTQQLQQTQQGLQHWQQAAQTLQMQATEASSQQKQADARKKDAETRKIDGEMGFAGPGNLATVEKISDIELNRAQAAKNYRDARSPNGRG